MKTNTNEISFTLDNLKKAITKLNKLLASPENPEPSSLSSNNSNKIESGSNTNLPSKDEKNEKLKKIITYINKYSESLKNSKDETVLEYLSFLAENLSEKVYAEQGDEIMEDLWKLYRINTGQLKLEPYSVLYKLNPLKKNSLRLEIGNNPEYFLNLVFMNEKLTQRILEDKIICFNKEKKEVKFSEEVSKLAINMKNENQNLSSAIRINNILDLMFLKIMSVGDMKTFYTILSSMLMLTEGKTILIFKIISYFALCLFTFENKESFVGSLLFIIGGMLRDYAKSYTKTKGLERVIFSEHKCAHQDHERQFFESALLNQTECEFLENNFLDIIKEFLSIIINSTYKNSDKDPKWDSFRSIFVKYLHYEKMDIEEPIPSDVQITQYFTLFISEFLFTFVCGFCEFDSEKGKIKTHFRNFDNFAVFVLQFLTSKFTNVLSIFEFAQKKISIIQTDCEKTEYILTDKFNAYGVYFILLLALEYSNFNSNTANNLDENILKFTAENKIFFYPKLFSKQFNSGVILEVLRSICSIENQFSHERKGHLNVFYHKLIENYLGLINNFYQGSEIKFMDPNKPKSNGIGEENDNKKIEIVSSAFSKHFSKFILEYLNIKSDERNEKLLMSFSALFEDKLYLIHDISKQIRNKQDYLAFFEYFNSLLQHGLIEEKLILISLILLLVKGINAEYLLHDEVKENLKAQISLAKNISKLSYEVAINDVIEDLKCDVDSPKKLNVKHKIDPNSDIFEAFVFKKHNDNNLFIQVLESFLDTLRN